MPDLSDTVAKCRMGTAKKFYTSIASLSHTSNALRVLVICFGCEDMSAADLYI